MKNSKLLANRFTDFLKKRGHNTEVEKSGPYFANIRYENKVLIKIYVKKSGDTRISLPDGIDKNTTFELMKNWELFNGRYHEGIHIYVDGTFINNTAGYGYIVIKDNDIIKSGSGITKDDSSLRNVTGEIFGVLEGVKYCASNKFESVVIHYDYEGLKKWVTGDWKTNKNLTRSYKDKMTTYSRKIKILWQKEPAHSGITYNELADRLAKKAVETTH
ncbi:MAG: RNase H family protein [Kosmotogaceae bacterium]